MDFETLSQWADEELKAVIKILPADVQAAAKKCSISLEDHPGRGTDDESLEGDELGLFEGTCLFLSNIWEWVGAEEQDYRDEVGTTFLHELGHYLGWDEDEVADRGLE